MIIPHKPITKKILIKGLTITEAIIPTGVIEPNKTREKGIVQSCAPMEAEKAPHIFGGRYGMSTLYENVPIVVIPIKAEYDSKKDIHVPS